MGCRHEDRHIVAGREVLHLALGMREPDPRSGDDDRLFRLCQQRFQLGHVVGIGRGLVYLVALCIELARAFGLLEWSELSRT